MNLRDLQEESDYLKSELMKEFEQLEVALEGAKKSLSQDKSYRLAEAGFVSRGSRIEKLTARITTLDKVIKMMEKQ